jgi:hypothetical protein
MKYYLFYYIVICSLIVSCKKDASSPASSKVKLVKTITTSTNSNSGWLVNEVDSFAYDNQNRLVYFIVLPYKGSSFSSSATYEFSYSGSSTIPTGYVLSYNPVSQPFSTDNYSGRHIILVNSQNQIILDSVDLTTNAGGINRYTAYGDNLFVHTWGKFGSDGLLYAFQMDSIFTDENNVKQIAVGVNQTQGSDIFTFHLIWSYYFTYDSVSNPLYNTSASLIIFLMNGYYASRSCTSTYKLNYTFNSVDTTESSSFQNNTDLNGLLQNTITQETGQSRVYSYY